MKIVASAKKKHDQKDGTSNAEKHPPNKKILTKNIKIP